MRWSTTSSYSSDLAPVVTSPLNLPGVDPWIDDPAPEEIKIDFRGLGVYLAPEEAQQLAQDLLQATGSTDYDQQRAFVQDTVAVSAAGSLRVIGPARYSGIHTIKPPRAEPNPTIPLYAMLDIWMALYGSSHPEFDEFYAEHGYAETWARLCSAITGSGSITSDAVERAAKQMFEDPLGAGDYTWAQMVNDDPTRADIWRQDARDVLRAAFHPQEPTTGEQP